MKPGSVPSTHKNSCSSGSLVFYSLSQHEQESGLPKIAYVLTLICTAIQVLAIYPELYMIPSARFWHYHQVLSLVLRLPLSTERGATNTLAFSYPLPNGLPTPPAILRGHRDG